MKIDIVSIFPQIFNNFLKEGMIRIATEKKLLEIVTHDLRDYTLDKHKQVDDEPYGGGPGMVMKVEPFFRAVTSILDCSASEISQKGQVILFSPRGNLLDMETLKALSRQERLLLLCGRYEGVDERVAENIATMEISIGDYVLSGGEVPAMALIEGVVRLIPDVLGDGASAKQDSFSNGLLEYPQYTRPAEYKGWKVPDILLSGNHQEIADWRNKKAYKRTKEQRPDLISEE